MAKQTGWSALLRVASLLLGIACAHFLGNGVIGLWHVPAGLESDAAPDIAPCNCIACWPRRGCGLPGGLRLRATQRLTDQIDALVRMSVRTNCQPDACAGAGEDQPSAGWGAVGQVAITPDGPVRATASPTTIQCWRAWADGRRNPRQSPRPDPAAKPDR